MIAALSSRTILRAASLWPSRVSMSISAWPDLSSASLRVSETVRIAMLTGRKGRVSSILPGIEAVTGLHGGALGRRAVVRGIGRPSTASKRIEIGHRLAQTLAIDPIIRQHFLREDARLFHGDALDEKQRIVAVFGMGRLPARGRRRSLVIGRCEEDQIVADMRVAEQELHIFLRQHQIVFRVVERGALFLAVALAK